ncbi:ABC transporter ATP-binding protein [Shouchella shacheensis]|uniref:ABC transporter ATP-binding protein n=1 Tax=Shouchella shacheensis TaxID=1649580 RepID=UPI000AB3EA74|nr:ABC transporter ATP-binding protein [Shouchella shacheensis]
MIAASVHDLRLAFPKSETLLFDGLDLTIEKGEKVLFLGPSGCGKSTLLQVLSGLFPEVIDIPMRTSHATVPQRSGFVFQDPDTQFCMPFVDEELGFVLENLQVPRKQMNDRIASLLKKVGIKLETLHTPIQHLSQGMKQRLAIASMHALEADTLFLDEPTSLLDPEGTAKVWATIKEMSVEKTVIIVEHKIDHILDYVDRIVLFSDNGMILADGKPADIWRNHQREIDTYGIWHPSSWSRHLQEATFSPVNKQGPLHLSLKEWKAWRGKKKVASVEQAHVQGGEWVTIVGENGAGKSTLLYALMNLLPTTGTYKVNERSIHGKSPLAGEIGFVFQNPEFQFVTDRVMDELMFLKDPSKEERALALLDRFDLLDKKDVHPYQLSTGQKRRLSVCTALVGAHSILMLDEPTFGQDAKNTFSLLQLLETCRAEETTIVMVTHDEEIVKQYATSVWTIKGGKQTRIEAGERVDTMKRGVVGE